jgi:membrane protein required for colicin V production
MWLDILTGTILFIALLQGYKNGVIRALISFFSLFIGLVLAFQFAGWVAGQLKAHTNFNSYWVPFISFLIVLVAVLIVLRFTTRLLQQTAEWLMLAWLNKLLGILLYGLIYFTILSAVVYFFQLLGILEANKMKDTYTYSYLQRWWPYCLEKLSIWVPSIKQSILRFSKPIF